MAFNKLVLVLLLAVASSQAAPQPAPRDLRVVLLKVISICDIVGNKLIAGIAEAKPIVKELEEELNPSLAENVHSLLTKLETYVNDIVTRLNFLEGNVTDAMNTVQNEAGSCMDKADVSLDKVLDVSEKGMSDVFNSLLVKYDSNFTSIKNQIVTILQNLDTATDLGISTGVGCVKRGSTTVHKCMDDNTEAWKASIVDAIVNITLVFNEALALAQVVLPEAFAAIQAIGVQTDANSESTWEDFGKCMAAMS